MTSSDYAASARTARRDTAQSAVPQAISVLFFLSAAIFLLSLLIGMWVAYDVQGALLRFGWLMAGVLFALLAPRFSKSGRSRALNLLGLFCAVGAAGLGGYFILQTLGVVGVQGPTGTAWLFGNAVAGGLIVLLPLGLGSALFSWRRQKRATSIAVFGLLLVGTLALLLTGSRGALLGLMAGALMALYASWRTARQPTPWIRVIDIAVVATVAGSLAVYVVVVATPLLDQWLGIPQWGGSPSSRIVLWRDTFPLIRDYVFTGSGLGGTDRVYSSYVFLLHVPYFYHAHNLYMQIVVEQGLLGLIGYAGMMAAGVWALWICLLRLRGSVRVFAAAALAAVVALLVHGLFDAEIYVSPLVVLLFLPLAFAGMLLKRVRGESAAYSGMDYRSSGVARAVGISGIAALLVVLLAATAVMAWPRARATLEANLGAVSQTRAELSVYRWPEWSIQDEVRRTYPERLEPAVIWYERALLTDPANATAHRRLGQIELSLGDYAAALAHLEAAYAQAPHERATRQMLGEAYAVTGRADEAAALWQTVDIEAGQLDARVWWYDHYGTEQEATGMAGAVGALHAEARD